MNSFAALQARFNALALREQSLVGLAALLVAVALLWWLALAPALATLRAAPAQHANLDAQIQQMQALRAQAQAMQAQPPMASDEARRQLEAITKQRLPGANLLVTGDRATLTLKAASSDALAQFLSQARANARVLPLESRLAKQPVEPPLWDGSLVLVLPVSAKP